MVLINGTDEEARGHIEFLKSDGTPLVTRFPETGMQDSAYWFKIPPKGSVLVKTSAEGPGATGYANVIATSPVGGTVIFSQFDDIGNLVTEAAVGSVQPMDFFTLPVDATGDFNTGIAIANTRAGEAVTLYLKLLNESGQTLDNLTLTLGPGEQLARFVAGPGQFFPGISNVRGSLQVLSDAPVNAVALRSTGRTLTALPVASMNQPLAPATLYFPHVVVGSGTKTYRSTIILNNPGYFPVSGKVRFIRSDGGEMIVNSGLSSAATIAFKIDPQGTLFIQARSASDLSTGYAILEADHCVDGVLVFSQSDPGSGELETEAAVPASPRYKDFLLFAQAEDGYASGFAVANITSSASALDYFLRTAPDSASILEKGPVALDSGRHMAAFVSGNGQLFPAFSGHGTLEVMSDSPIPAVSLRITASTMTALPVIPLP